MMAMTFSPFWCLYPEKPMPSPLFWPRCWPYRRERAITCNKRYLFSLQSLTDSTYRTLDAHKELSPLVDHQPASACQTRRTEIVREFRSSMVVAAHPRWRRTELLIPFYCVSSHVPSCRANYASAP